MSNDIHPALPFDDIAPRGAAKRRVTRAEKHNDYEGFVDKFKPRKTTDDCYTPPAIYDEVVRWVD